MSTYLVIFNAVLATWNLYQAYRIGRIAARNRVIAEENLRIAKGLR